MSPALEQPGGESDNSGQASEKCSDRDKGFAKGVIDRFAELVPGFRKQVQSRFFFCFDAGEHTLRLHQCGFPLACDEPRFRESIKRL